MDQPAATWTTERPFQSLALTGGGFCGLFTAKVLQVIEERLGEPIGRRFDLTTGTSIGGIVALAIAFEVPMKKVVEVFEQCGPKIFPPRRPPTTLLGKFADLLKYKSRPRYSTVPLRNAITLLIGDALLGDALHPVTIPAVNLTTGRPQVFKTRHLEAYIRDCRYKAVDIALATSAAPTFFELAEIDDSRYADGGLFANAPDLMAIHEAEHYLHVPVEAQRLLSIGTTTQKFSISSGSRNFGIGDWMEDQRLFNVIISAQQQFAHEEASHRLGTERYLRLDHEPSDQQAMDLGLDVATDIAKKTLTALGKKTATDAMKKIDVYLQHKPQLALLKCP